MAKNKAAWIKEINGLEKQNAGLLGDISPEELETMTVSLLKKTHKEMLESLEAKDNNDEPAADADGKFASMCGSEFNPKKSGSCHKECQADFPEAFQACSENYKTTDISPRRETKPRLGKTEWGHINGKQGGLIDDWFLNNKEPATLAEVSTFAGGKEQRVMHHMKHLVADLNIEILYNMRTVTDKVDGKEVKRKVKQYWWKEKDKRRKGEALPGKSAYPSK